MSKIQVNEIVNHFDNGAPDCPRGLTVAGVSTFSGDVSIGGTLTYEDVTNIDSVGIITAQSGIQVTGGSIGIGTDTPGALLSIESTAPNAARLRIGFDSPRYYDIFRGSTSNSGYLNFYGSQTGFTGYIFDGVDGERLRIDSSGRLLKSGQAALTSTSLNHPIQVAAASDANAIAIIGRAADDIAELSFYEADKTTKLGELQYRQDHLNFRHRVGYISFATGGTTERMRIDSSGNIGINCAAPGSLLELNAAAATVMGISLGTVSDTITASRYIGICNNTDQTNLGANSGFQGIEFGGPSSANEGYLALHTHDNGVASGERMRIDKSGNVMVGTTTPESESILTVNESKSSANYVSFENRQNYGWGVGIKFRQPVVNNGAIINSGRIYSGWEASGKSYMQFNTYDSAAGGEFGRLRIDSSGNILGAKTSTSFNVTGTILSPAGGIYATTVNDTCFFANRTGSDGGVFGFYRNGAVVGSISITSSSTSYNTSSDYRLKENVVEITDGITRVKQLAPKRFNFIADDTATVDGFLAHEAQEVVPEAVTGTKDAVDDEGKPVYQGIDQSKLIPLLTAALQEAITKIETLEAEVQALKGN